MLGHEAQQNGSRSLNSAEAIGLQSIILDFESHMVDLSSWGAPGAYWRLFGQSWSVLPSNFIVFPYILGYFLTHEPRLEVSMSIR